MVREEYLLSCADINLKYLRISRDIAAAAAIMSRGDFNRFCAFDNLKVRLEVVLKDCINSLEGYSSLSPRYVSVCTLDAEKTTRQMTGLVLDDELTDYEIKSLSRKTSVVGRLPEIFDVQQSINKISLDCVDKLVNNLTEYIEEISSGRAYSGAPLSLIKILLVMVEYYHKALKKFTADLVPDFGEPDLKSALYSVFARTDISRATVLGGESDLDYRAYFLKSATRSMFEFTGDVLPLVADIALRFVF